MTSQERKFQIVRVLILQAFDNEPGIFTEQWFTLRQVARLVGLQPTQYLRDLLTELARENAVEIGEGKAPNGMLRYQYSVLAYVINSEKYHEPFAKYFHEQGW